MSDSNWSERDEDHFRMFTAAAARQDDMPYQTLDGRGIVICSGGRYDVCTYVLMNRLRQLGCNLPVQIWYRGVRERNDVLQEVLRPLGVEFADAETVRESHPARILRGWEIKAYAMIHSPFREVMLLDADNVPVKDPTYLFDAAPYKKHGAVFWPDYERLQPERKFWRACDVAYRDEPEFETGQILVDKSRCWRALGLTMWINEYSDYYYGRVMHGDKETFHMAWLRLGQPYAMIPTPIHTLLHTMCQHDFDGQRVFQHRNFDKWSLDGNIRIEGFEGEDACLELIEQYRRELVRCPAAA